MSRPRALLEKLIRSSAACIALCLTGTVQCLSPLDAPSAFEDERFLCDDTAEFEALLEQCRDARRSDLASCAGVVSFEGVIDSHPVVLDEFVTSATYVESARPAGLLQSALTLKGDAPYFTFSLYEAYTIERKTGEPGEVLVVEDLAFDTNVINLESRGGNYFSTFIAPERQIELVAPSEVRSRLRGELVRDGRLDLCFYAFSRPFGTAE